MSNFIQYKIIDAPIDICWWIASPIKHNAFKIGADGIVSQVMFPLKVIYEKYILIWNKLCGF